MKQHSVTQSGWITLASGVLAAMMMVKAKASPSIRAVSLAAPGTPQLVGGNSDSAASTISLDGRYVLFLSSANNLVTNDDTGLFIDVFLRDRNNGTTTLVSRNTAGTGGGNCHSLFPSMSSNGRYVAFSSSASNLVANDVNGVADIFVRDLVTETTVLVSVNQSGTGGGNGESSEPVMSADGRYVAFTSAANDLVPNDTNGIADVFIRDLQSGITVRASENAVPPSSGGGGSGSPGITPDGLFLAFVSSSSNLVSGITNNFQDVYVRNLQTGVTTWAGTNLASIMLGVTNAPGKPVYAFNPVLSDDGRFLAFKAGGPAGLILRHDLQTGTTELVSTNAVGDSFGLEDSYGPEMSPDGRFIAYTAHVSTNDLGQVYRWDAQSGVSALVSVSVDGGVSTNGFADTPAMSADGRFVTFLSDASDLVGNAADGTIQVFVRDLVQGTTRLVSADTAGGVSGESGGAIPTISADGRFIAFDSFDGGYVANDYNEASDVFVRDISNNSTELVSQQIGGLTSTTANGFSSLYANAVSADGRFVVFASDASNLIQNDTNGVGDVFVRDLQSGSNVLVSASIDGGGGNLLSSVPSISRDGHYVVFVSSATNLVAADLNGKPDIFVRDLVTGTTELVSQNMNFTGAGSASANGESSSPAISSDGRYVAFLSQATNLAPGFASARLNVFWRDRETGTTVALTTSANSRGSSGDPPAMSSDGRVVAYSGLNAVRVPSLYVRDMLTQTNLLNGEFSSVSAYALSTDGGTLVFQTNSAGGALWTFAWDVRSGSNKLLSIAPPAAASKSGLGISDDGRFVAITSKTNTPFVTDGHLNVFLYDLQTATATMISVNTNGIGGGNDNSDSPALSGDGRFVAFRSFASDLVTNDNNGWADVFVFDRLTSAMQLVSENRTSTGTGNGISAGPVIAADGSRIIFRSVASDLVDGDLNETQDVFYYEIAASALVDTDADGMDDNWERAHFGDLSHDGTADSDGDGMSDLEEFLTGTDPLNRNSVFAIQNVNRSPAGMTTLSWQAAAGRGYRAQFKNDLGDPLWTDLPGWVTVTGATASITDATSTPSRWRFYRILLVE